MALEELCWCTEWAVYVLSNITYSVLLIVILRYIESVEKLHKCSNCHWEPSVWLFLHVFFSYLVNFSMQTLGINTSLCPFGHNYRPLTILYIYGIKWIWRQPLPYYFVLGSFEERLFPILICVFISILYCAIFHPECGSWNGSKHDNNISGGVSCCVFVILPYSWCFVISF